MRHSLLFLSFAAVVSAAPLTALADDATLSALQNANIELSTELAAQVNAAQGQDIATAMADVVSALGNDGEAIRAAIAAAVAAHPELAMEITSAVCLANPGVCAIVAGAAASAAPAMAPDIAAAAAHAQPSQQNLIVNTIIASVNNEAMNAAILRAVAGAFDNNKAGEPGSGVPSPN
jgi:hypothetical protein